MSFRVIPVIDLMDGIVVHGLGGRRSEYRPINSRLVASANARDVGIAFRKHFRFTEVYLADLDAIAGQTPRFAIYQELQEFGLRLWVDAGVRSADNALRLAAANVDTVVLGLETLDGPEVLQPLVQADADRFLFSLDLKAGHPIGRLEKWAGPDAMTIARQVVNLGIKRSLILDLARVGGNQGAGTTHLLAELRTLYPRLELVAGGGVKGIEDLLALKEFGASAVLVASALHNGALQPLDLRKLEA